MAESSVHFYTEPDTIDRENVKHILQAVQDFHKANLASEDVKKPTVYLGESQRDSVRKLAGPAEVINLEIPTFFGVKIVWVHLGSHIKVYS